MPTYKVVRKGSGEAEEVEALSCKQALFKSALSKTTGSTNKDKRLAAGALYAAMLKSHEAIQINGSIQLELFK